MNKWSCCVDQARLLAWVLGVAGTFLILGALSWLIIWPSSGFSTKNLLSLPVTR